MKGTILDFLKLAADKPQLAKDLVALAAKYDFEFDDEVNDDELDMVSGGADAMPDICKLPDPDVGGPVPIPYPKVGAEVKSSDDSDSSSSSSGDSA